MSLPDERCPCPYSCQFDVMCHGHCNEGTTMTTSPKPTKDEALMQTVLGKLDALGDDAAVHIWPEDLDKCGRAECTAVVYSVRMGSPDGKTIPLFSREQVEAAIHEALAQPAADDKAGHNRTHVDSGALTMALNVLRRAGKDEVAEALEQTAVRGADDKAGGEAVGEVDGDGMAVFWANKPLNGAKLYTRPQPQAEYIIEAEWPDRFGVPLEVINVTNLGGGKVGIRVKPHESRASILAERPAERGAQKNDCCAPNHFCDGRMIHLPEWELCNKCGHGITGKDQS